MSWGCPAIVANATAMPESVADAGLLAEPGNAEEFAAHVMDLYDHPDQRAVLVQRGFKLARARSWTQAARAFEAEFAAILTGEQRVKETA
jgi:glycosyltransferase involved in cell wall biosynthesis